jgi:hypothetical protein
LTTELRHIDGMARPRLAGRQTSRRYWAAVLRRHRGTKPFGWLIYRCGEDGGPVAQSTEGYLDEAEAWSAAGSALKALENDLR